VSVEIADAMQAASAPIAVPDAVIMFPNRVHCKSLVKTPTNPADGLEGGARGPGMGKRDEMLNREPMGDHWLH
jgi:hypothetical protein